MQTQKIVKVKRNPIIDGIFFGLLMAVTFAFSDYISSGSTADIVMKAIVVGLGTGLVLGVVERIILKRLMR